MSSQHKNTENNTENVTEDVTEDVTENKGTGTGTVQDIMVILDKSGSMASMGEEPLQALNAFIKEQQETMKNVDGSRFSLWMFATVAHLVIDDQPLQDIAPITDYVPDGMTAMNDAIGKAVTLKSSKSKNKHVICMVITDGEENSSREFSTQHIKSIIKRAEKEKNWKFIFVGAKDIFAQGAKAGFVPTRCAAFAPRQPGHLLNLSRQISQTVSQYRRGSSQGVQCDINLRQSTAPAVLQRRDAGPVTSSLRLRVLREAPPLTALRDEDTAMLPVPTSSAAVPPSCPCAAAHPLGGGGGRGGSWGGPYHGM